jgi:hypothetical protein
MRPVRWILVAALLVCGPCSNHSHAGPFKRLFKGRQSTPSSAGPAPAGASPGQMPPGFQALTPLAGQSQTAVGGYQVCTPEGCTTVVPSSTSQAGRVVMAADEVPVSQVLAAPAPAASTTATVSTASQADTVATLTAQLNAMSEQLATLQATTTTAQTAAPVPTPAPTPTLVTMPAESSVVTSALEAKANRFLDAAAKKFGIADEVTPPQTPASDVLDSAGVFRVSLERPGMEPMEAEIDLTAGLREALRVKKD